MNDRQHTTPYLVFRRDGVSSTQELQQLDFIRRGERSISEDWLQDFIFSNPTLLPIAEVEPVFGPLIPVCREIETGAGPLDILFVNSLGMLTLVECKLWRNPEARREVVGQILDYAKQFSRWSYQDLQNAINEAIKQEGNSLYKLVAEKNEDVDEREFVDSVSRNLRLGRFLLLIVGDGIRESVEQITEFLQIHANLNFSFSLVEIAIFSLPSVVSNALLVQPRVITRTVEIERTIVRIENNQIVAETPPESTTKVKKIKITEQMFYEALTQVDSDSAQKLRGLLDQAQQEAGLIIVPGSASLSLKTEDKRFSFACFYKDGIVPGSASLSLKTEDKRFSFACFYKDGTVTSQGIAYKTEEIGHPAIGEAYLEGLASLIEGTKVYKPENRWYWTVLKKDDHWLTTADYLKVQEQWLALTRETMSQINSVIC